MVSRLIDDSSSGQERIVDEEIHQNHPSRRICFVTLLVTESVIEVNPTWAAERIS
jgi:hypothetical protein